MPRGKALLSASARTASWPWMNEPLERIGSVSELCERMMRERRYGALAMVAVNKLGGDPENLRDARAWLTMLAAEGDEQSVLDMVNACRELV